MNEKDRKKVKEIEEKFPFHESSETCRDPFYIQCRDAYWLISKLRETWDDAAILKETVIDLTARIKDLEALLEIERRHVKEKSSCGF